MIPVDSENVSTAGYSHDTGDLYVEFHSGSKYHYKNVPPTLYREMMAAERPGHFFAHRIKPHWKGVKIT
jgi:hypothetical protein